MLVFVVVRPSEETKLEVNVGWVDTSGLYKPSAYLPFFKFPIYILQFQTPLFLIYIATPTM